MDCINCGASLPGDARFCYKCGTAQSNCDPIILLKKLSERCTPLPDVVNFCYRCGCDLRRLTKIFETGSECCTKISDRVNFCARCGCDLRGLTKDLATEYLPTHELWVGEYIMFGNYYKNNGETKEPIEWQVLDVQGNKALIISRYGVECKQFHHEGVDVTWEKSDLRGWMNNDFLKAAFSEDEMQRIKISNIRNDDNPNYHTNGGNFTKDRVFCLSIAEAEMYFQSDYARKCQSTDYANARGAWNTLVYPKYHESDYGNEVKWGSDSNRFCCWWLRSPGVNQACASTLTSDGSFNLYGLSVNDTHRTVRPALWVIWNQ